MASRRKRKRERQRAEATARYPRNLGGWGQGLPTSLADLVILRQAIRQDWDVSPGVRQAIVRELGEELESEKPPRRTLSICRTFLAMDKANTRAERRP